MTFVDFECKQCGRQEEVRYESIKDIKKEEKCCDCGSMMVRNYSPIGIKFVGSGFYVNDSKSKR